MNMLNKQICFLLAALLLSSSCFKRNDVNKNNESSSGDSVLFTRYQDAPYFKPEWSKENTLVYHVIAEADNLHPTNGTSYMRSEIMLYTQKFLVQTDMFQPQLRPDLVKSLPLISADGLSYTFELRDEPKWDDGSPLTVDDVIFTMKAHKCPLVNNPTLKPYIADIADIKPDEKNAKKFTVSMSKNYLLNVALWSDFGIMQRTFFDPENILSQFSIQQFNDTTFDAKKFPELIKWADKFNSPEYGTNPNMFNGLGMYKVSVWEPGVQLVLIKKKIPNINEAFLLDVSDEMYINETSQISEPFQPYEQLQKSIKVYGRVDAGLPADAWMNYEKVNVYHPVMDKIKGQLFGFKVAGDSMENLFSDGDIILGTQFNMPDEMPRDKDFVVVMFKSGPDSSKAIFKQFYWADKDEKFVNLKSINPNYETKFHKLKDIAKIFKIHIGFPILNKNLK